MKFINFGRDTVRSEKVDELQFYMIITLSDICLIKFDHKRINDLKRVMYTHSV